MYPYPAVREPAVQSAEQLQTAGRRTVYLGYGRPHTLWSPPTGKRSFIRTSKCLQLLVVTHGGNAICSPRQLNDGHSARSLLLLFLSSDRNVRERPAQPRTDFCSRKLFKGGVHTLRYVNQNKKYIFVPDLSDRLLIVSLFSAQSPSNGVS